MKKGIISLLSAAGGMAAGVAMASGMRKNMNAAQCIKTEKFRMYYQVLNQWLIVRQEGKSLVRFFQENGYRSIVIYGMGELGNRLLKELEGTEIRVKYCMDSNALTLDENMSVAEGELNTEDVDAVIITALFAFDEIEEKLRRNMKCDIVSLEEVVFGV